MNEVAMNEVQVTNDFDSIVEFAESLEQFELNRKSAVANYLSIRGVKLQSYLRDNANDSDMTRLLNFEKYLVKGNLTWLDCDLRDYRKFLETIGKDGKPYSSASIVSMVSTIKGIYKRLLLDTKVKQYAKHFLVSMYQQSDNALSEAETIVIVNDIFDTATVGMQNVSTKKADEQDENTKFELGTRLDSNSQLRFVEFVLNSGKALAIRDSAMFALGFALGLRATELVRITFDDFKIRSDDGQSTYVFRIFGKGSKTRTLYVKYDNQLIQYFRGYIEHFELHHGLVFRSFSPKITIQDGGITTNSLLKTIKGYEFDGMILTPHDMRYSCAFALAKLGVSIYSIQGFLAHESVETTRRYIGNVSANDKALW